MRIGICLGQHHRRLSSSAALALLVSQFAILASRPAATTAPRQQRQQHQAGGCFVDAFKAGLPRKRTANAGKTGTAADAFEDEGGPPQLLPRRTNSIDNYNYRRVFGGSWRRTFAWSADRVRLFSTNGNSPGGDGGGGGSFEQKQLPRNETRGGVASAAPRLNELNGMSQPASPPPPSVQGDQPVVAAAGVGNKNSVIAQPQFADVSSLLAINPCDIEIVTVKTPQKEMEESSYPDASLIRQLPFVSMFRGSANYIANHRNTLAVYHIPGGLLDLPDPAVFRDLMNDVALTWLLGMKVVLVVGCRHQIEKRIPSGAADEDDFCHGLRVTDESTLRIVKEEAGYVRFEVERQLARSLRMQGSGTSTKGGAFQGYYDGNVVSGNFYSAQPFGILDGVDYSEYLPARSSMIYCVQTASSCSF